MLPMPKLMPPTFWAPGYDHEGVGADAGEGALDGEGRAVADLHHGDDRRDADDDAERGEQGAHDVAPEGAGGRLQDAVQVSCGVSFADPSMRPSLMRMIRLGVTRHARIVGDEDDGDALVLVELLEHFKDLLAGVGIEVPRRLVGEEHLGAVDERPRDGDALLLAAGELGGLMVDAVRQADFVQHLHGPLLSSGAR